MSRSAGWPAGRSTSSASTSTRFVRAAWSWRRPRSGGSAMSDDEHTTDTGQDAGGKAHTGLDEEHPAGDGPRTDRDVGGPTPAEGEEGSTGTEPGAHGNKPTEGFAQPRVGIGPSGGGGRLTPRSRRP